MGGGSGGGGGVGDEQRDAETASSAASAAAVVREHLSMDVDYDDDDDGGEANAASASQSSSSSGSSDVFVIDERPRVDGRHDDGFRRHDGGGEHDGRHGGEEEIETHHSLPTPEDLEASRGRRRGGQGGEEEEEATVMQTIAGVAGNVLEWYDFAIFGYFGDIIGDVFFPPQAGHAAIVESFAVFGGAFMMRPVGGMMMGYIGDKFGRKRALEMSIFLMAFPTFLMGCLPGYDLIGSWAVLLLAVTRCLQGMSVGGQLMSSLVFTLEKHPKAKWGLYGSYVLAAANVGTLLGGVVGFVMRATLTMDQLRSWGWRVPFLAGILVSLSGVYLRFRCEEGDMAHHHHGGGHGGGESPPPSNPIRAAFSRGNRRSLLSATLVPMLWSAGFYLTFVWLSIFMSDLEVPPVPDAFAVNSLSLLVSVCLFFPIGGMLSDRYGRKRIMLIGGAAMGILSPIMVLVIGRGDPLAAFCAQSIMGVSLTLWGAPMMAWLVESFPPAARLTSVAIGYNVAQATAGGFAPAIATVIVDRYGGNAPGFILSVLALLSLTGLLIAPPPQDGVESTLVPREGVGGDDHERVHFSYTATNDDEQGEEERTSDVAVQASGKELI